MGYYREGGSETQTPKTPDQQRTSACATLFPEVNGIVHRLQVNCMLKCFDGLKEPSFRGAEHTQASY